MTPCASCGSGRSRRERRRRQPRYPAPAAAAPAPKGLREVIYRHTVLVRITHWINALAIFFMIGSGLTSSTPTPRSTGAAAGRSSIQRAAGSPLHAINTPQGPRGVTEVLGLHFNTTGLFGWSKVGDHFAARGFPAWLTIPSFQDLADARHWHFFFAWLLVTNGLVYLIWSLSIRHIQRDIVPTGGRPQVDPQVRRRPRAAEAPHR